MFLDPLTDHLFTCFALTKTNIPTVVQRCHCTPGFKLAEDGDTCVDIDECAAVNECADSLLRVCSHLCVNTPGSFQCQCHPGYVMQADGRHCKITGDGRTAAWGHTSEIVKLFK